MRSNVKVYCKHRSTYQLNRGKKVEVRCLFCNRLFKGRTKKATERIKKL